MELNEQKIKSKKLTKNQKRRLKKKEKKINEKSQPQIKQEIIEVKNEIDSNSDSSNNLEIEYVTPPQFKEISRDFDELKEVFSKFSSPEELTNPEEDNKIKSEDEDEVTNNFKRKVNETQETQLSNKKKKLLRRLTVAQLKQLVKKPEVVEVCDVTAPDPRILIYLKSYRNTVPVPRHWCQKRKYLQGKRGVEKLPYQLPDYIAATGISELRSAVKHDDDKKSLKSKARQRMNPKLGRMVIDYSVLHSAFFKYQTKPYLTKHGDMYYEGKEFEVKLREKTPGRLSEELRQALGMQDNAPPPWLMNMQRYGPPPSYPNLKIPGLNCPIPPGTSYGYGVGQWGKPPLDKDGNPLYGDVYGTESLEDKNLEDAFRHMPLWGEQLEADTSSEEEEEIEEEENEEEEEKPAITNTYNNNADTNVIPEGVYTPANVQLRKGGEEQTPMNLGPNGYVVLKEEKAHVGENELVGSDHKYIIPKTQ